MEALVKELESIAGEIIEIARSVDQAEQRRNVRRPLFTKVKKKAKTLLKWISGDETQSADDEKDLWLSVPQVAKGTTDRLAKVIDRCNAASDKLGKLGSQ